jgi:putative Mg2+ transporter-C (MgtC) family protein
MNILEVTLKLLLAVALGGLVGLERETSQKPAGFRTNILICVGSAALMILAGMILKDSPVTGNEMTRIAAGAVTGIGFIGAGTIIQSRGSVLGLTTAATLWTVSALGLMIGAGYTIVALIVTAVIMATLILFRKVESHFLKRSYYRYEIKTAKSRELLVYLKKIALHEGIKFQNLQFHHSGEEAKIVLSFMAPDDKEEQFNRAILSREDITEIRID